MDDIRRLVDEAIEHVRVYFDDRNPALLRCKSEFRDYDLEIQKRAKTIISDYFSEDIDPYSDSYFEMQLDLWRSMSNRRTLCQAKTEISDWRCANSFLVHANPFTSKDILFVSDFVRKIAEIFQIVGTASLKVLDMGAGRGILSEAMNYCGADVDALDINPEFNSFARERYKLKHLDIKRIESNFDDVRITLKDGHYDLIVFNGCLHHALKPWKLIEDLKSKLSPGGIIVLMREPIQSVWWKSWGLRMDVESMWVTRRFGWFESGFSLPFLFSVAERCKYGLLSVFRRPQNNPYVFICKDMDVLQNLALNSKSEGFQCLQNQECLPVCRDRDSRGSLVVVSETSISVAPGCRFTAYVRVANLSDAVWRSVPTDRSSYHLSYHYVAEDGAIIQKGGLRTSFSRPLNPYESDICQVLVEAPQIPGRYCITVDVVQEGVKWLIDNGLSRDQAKLSTISVNVCA